MVAAADFLAMSPSAVSQQIAQLEHEVGVEVIDRTPAGSVLTPAGRILADLGEHFEVESASAARALAGLAGQVTGAVVVGGFQTVIRNVLLPLLGQVGQELPGVEVSIREVAGTEGMRELRGGTVDLLIVERDSDRAAPAPRGTRDVPYIDEPWLLVQPDGEPQPNAIADLAGTTWLAVDPAAASAQATDRLLGALADPQISIHRYADYDVALDMVRAGLGSTVLPYLAVTGNDSDGIQVTRLPGLGVRQLTIRHRTSRGSLEAAHSAVLDLISRTATSIQPGDAGAMSDLEVDLGAE